MKKVLLTVALCVCTAALSFAQVPSVIGEWELTTVSPMGENTNTVEFKKDGEVIKAFAKGPQGERPYDSTAVEGDKVTLVMTIDFQGQPMTITYAGTVSGTDINGAADFGGLAQGSFSAKKKAADAAK